VLNSFLYGDIDSYEEFHITCDRETQFILPEQKQYTQEVPGMDGVIDYEIGGYGVRVMPTKLYYEGDYAELRANRERIIAWLANDKGKAKKLVFGDDPTRYYMAKCFSAIDFTFTSDREIGTVQFVSNPPWCYIDGVLQTPEEIAWQTAVKDGNQFMQEFTASGHMRFTNIGTQAVKPKITLLNNVPAELAITYSGGTITNNVELKYDSMIIDCSAETVTRGSDGSNLLPNISGDFFDFQPGQINLDIFATLSAWPDNLIVLVEFIPQGVG
jgi:predicted phage tail component-like protein